METNGLNLPMRTVGQILHLLLRPAQVLMRLKAVFPVGIMKAVIELFATGGQQIIYALLMNLAGLCRL